MLTSKDFEKAAEFVIQAKKIGFDNHTNSNISPVAIATVILSDVFSESNPNFDKERFYKACGYEP